MERLHSVPASWRSPGGLHGALRGLAQSLEQGWISERARRLVAAARGAGPGGQGSLRNRVTPVQAGWETCSGFSFPMLCKWTVALSFLLVEDCFLS